MKKKILYLGIIILIVMIAMSSGNNNNDEGEKIKTKNNPLQEQQTVPVFQKQEQDIKAHAVQYTIVNEEDISIKAMDKSLSSYTQEELVQLPFNIRMTYSIIVPSDIKKDELKATLIKVVKEKIQENQDIDEITVFAYDNEQDINSFYTFGKIEWCPNGKWDDVTSTIASTNNRSSYKYVFDIKEKVGQEEGNPTAREIEIYNVYWEKLNESGNPRGYTNHPTTLENSNKWEKIRIQQVLDIYNISHDELFDIVIKVSIWKLK
ncbi:MAG: hypothetical protein U9N04_01105 [Patescibacteria group bacterium]|nr:hypothetical protein [Patescibacteria group bacterium]